MLCFMYFWKFYEQLKYDNYENQKYFIPDPIKLHIKREMKICE